MVSLTLIQRRTTVLVYQGFPAFSCRLLKVSTTRRRTHRGGASVETDYQYSVRLDRALVLARGWGFRLSTFECDNPYILSPSSVTDKQALIALYNATDGPNWNYSDYWLTDAPIWAWYGVTVDAEGRVTELDL